MPLIIALDIGNSKTKLQLPDAPLISLKNWQIKSLAKIHPPKFNPSEKTIISASTVIEHTTSYIYIQNILHWLNIYDYELKIWRSTEILELALPKQVKSLTHIGSDRALKIYHLSQINSHYALLSCGCGTGFTIEVVAKESLQLSQILPGLRLQLDSLAKHTAKLPAIKMGEIANILHNPQYLSTRHSIVDGIISSYCNLIKSSANEWQVQEIILSGGYAPLIATELLLRHQIKSTLKENLETQTLVLLAQKTMLASAPNL
jgi:pantothenate kinase type III